MQNISIIQLAHKYMEPLKDPCNDRFLRQITPPPARPLTHGLLFPKNGSLPDWQLLKSHFQQEGRLSKPDCLQIVTQANNIFLREPNLLHLEDPVTIIGDIHGQYYDLIKILELAGDLSNTKYLFLGDYVDRGAFSIEVLLLLYSLKINFPSTILMLRGNHECRQLTSFFNFRAECLIKYDLEVYERITESFDALPLSCLVNKRFLSLHGGISPDLKSLQDLASVQRFTEPPRVGLFCDILWADPIGTENGAFTESFKPNDVRGCSFYFTAHSTRKFLKKNKLLSIIRAHEAQIDGYKMYKWSGAAEFPVVITVFSAPNYCDVYNNKGAIIKFLDNCLHIQQYNCSEHPFILPNFMNIFTWSIPFVAEKVLEMMNHMLHSTSGKGKAENKGGIKEIEAEIKSQKLEKLRNKVRAISRMMKMFKTLRNDNELIVQLKGLCPDNKIPIGILMQGKEAIEGVIDSFSLAEKYDRINERRPTLSKK